MASATIDPTPHRLLYAASEVLGLLENAGFDACAIGGLAVLRWGQPRVTQDVDVTVLAPIGDESAVVDFLLARLPARRPDARAFAMANRVLLLSATNGVPIDVGLAALPFEAEALRQARVWKWLPDVSFRVCAAEDLVIYKLAAGRRHDIDDMEGVVRLQWRDMDIDRIRARTSELSEMLDGTDLLAPFEAALARARGRLRGPKEQIES